jgi:parallel beta-helix repeat protein
MRALLVLAALAALGAASIARADTIVVRTSIQAAVDAAQPGDTVIVPPGRYHETVTIAKSSITIRGSRRAVLDASGFPVGIRAASGPSGPTCPPLDLHDIAIEGLRVENASFTGVLLRGVDGFSVTGGSYVDNAEYGVFPICSAHGTIARNYAEGSDDAVLYVGNSHDVMVQGNHTTDSTVGIEIENSTRVTVRGNTAIGNTSGIVALALPGLPVPEASGLLIERNVVLGNNRPNPVAPGEDVVGLIPAGTGILGVAIDDSTIRANLVAGNDSGGITIIALPFPNPDPRVDPSPDNVEVRRNVAVLNGRSPDVLRSPFPGADLIYDGSGSGVCFAGNAFVTDHPPGMTAMFPC